jgi:hypothetical protein
MDLEQPRGVGGSLIALGYHLADFNLLLSVTIGRVRDASLFAGGVNPGLARDSGGSLYGNISLSSQEGNWRYPSRLAIVC